MIILEKRDLSLAITNANMGSSHLLDRTAVRSVAEIGQLSLRLSTSQGASLGDFPLAPVCPQEKVTPSFI